MQAKRVEEIYDELGRLVVELEPNPLARGPGFLQELIARTRGFLNQASHYLHEIHRERHARETELNACEASFDVAAAELLAADERVIHLPTIEDRKAKVSVLLGHERKRVLSLKGEIRNLGHVEKAIRHRQRELDATMGAIRLQRSLLESEVRTGAFFGDETATSRGTRFKTAPAPVDELTDEELGELAAAFESSVPREPDSSEGNADESKLAEASVVTGDDDGAFDWDDFFGPSPTRDAVLEDSRGRDICHEASVDGSDCDVVDDE